MIHNDGIDILNVHTCFNDGGADENIGMSIHEILHGILQLPFIHLTMGHIKYHFWNELLKIAVHHMNIIHSVMHKVHLPISGFFS